MSERERIDIDRLIYRINGFAISILNEIGHGLREKTYERALCVDFKCHKISFDQQHVYPVYYRDEHIDDYIPDLQVESSLIVETKTVEKLRMSISVRY